MFTTAALSIGGFYTDLKLTADDTPAERINVLGDGGNDWHDRDNTPYFKRGADTLLAERGYARVGDWQYDASRDVHTATVAPSAGRVG